jgi:xylose isomerase
MLYYMDRIGWDGWVSYDVNSRQSAPIDTMSATIAAVKVAEQLLDRIGREQIAAFIAEGNPATAYTHLFRSLL